MRNACAAFAATFLVASVSAQQTVPFANGIPVAPEMPIPAMPAKPVEYATAEGMKIKVSVVTRGIEHPWSIAFVSNDVWLVTQTHGGLRVVRNGVLDPEPVKGAPEVKPARRSGLLEVTLHPKFAENKYVEAMAVRNRTLHGSSADVAANDAIVRRLSHESGFDQRVWQFPVILIPLGSAGRPDSVALRPVDSVDGMTARSVPMEAGLLAAMSAELLEIEGVCAVFYDLTHKPPGTIEWE